MGPLLGKVILPTPNSCLSQCTFQTYKHIHFKEIRGSVSEIVTENIKYKTLGLCHIEDILVVDDAPIEQENESIFGTGRYRSESVKVSGSKQWSIFRTRLIKG